MKNLLLAVLLFISQISFAQNTERIYELQENIKKGDFQALLEIANYFESKKKMIIFLGHRLINTDEETVSKRIVTENSFFTDNEINIDSSTAKQFKDFLMKSKSKITYSKDVNAFLITPFHKRTTSFEIQELTESKIKYLEYQKEELFNSNLVKSSKINNLLQQKNSKVLLELSSELLKQRNTFDYYSENIKEAVNLIRLLTYSNIAVPDETGKINYHIEEDFYETSKINLLIFFANNYKDYKWNASKKKFENKHIKRLKTGKEENLFTSLADKNDSIALNAFIQLSQSNNEKVTFLAKQYRKSRIEYNYVLPSFGYNFLEQLVLLTNFCNNNNIDYKGDIELQNNIEQLKLDLPFSERRKLEDTLVQNLTLDQITAFEYWTLIYEKEWKLNYSTGRILDKFYSKNWQKLVETPLYLESYLLKSKLFGNLGIIGYCNDYLKKFIGLNSITYEHLNSLKSENLNVQEQAKKAIKLSIIPIQFIEVEDKGWIETNGEVIEDFEASFQKLKNEISDIEILEKKISFLLSQINYNQITEALNSVETLDIEPSLLYSFMIRDFGFSFIGNFEDTKVRHDFIRRHSQLDEYNLYRHYLLDFGINFTSPDNSLDFDKIYEILKYDLNSAFAGGGGSVHDNGVYALIKLLELHFKSTLGYPQKLCNSNNMYACNARERANSWMNYLKENSLLKRELGEPISYMYEE